MSSLHLRSLLMLGFAAAVSVLGCAGNSGGDQGSTVWSPTTVEPLPTSTGESTVTPTSAVQTMLPLPVPTIPSDSIEVSANSPAAKPTGTPGPVYTTKHGKSLPLINTDELEHTLVLLMNDARFLDDLEGLVRASSLDEPAVAHSRHMADVQQAEARALETGCGGSGAQTVLWPQVKSFSYRGSDAAPTDITPTVYDEMVMEAASGVVEYILEGDAPYLSDPHYRYIGVGVVQEADEYGFMDFWITLYFADCLAESPNVTGTPVGTQHLLATPTTTDPPTPIPTPSRALSEMGTSTELAIASDTGVGDGIPTQIPIVESTPTPVASMVSLAGYINGRWLEQRDPQLATAIKHLEWVRDGIDEEESAVVQDLLYIAATSRPVVATILSLGWMQDSVKELEAGVIDWINNVGSTEVASRVVSLDWLEDGIEENELRAVEQISYIDYGDAEVASQAISLNWVEDGIESTEAEVLEALASIVNNNADEALRIVGMSFLETIEPPDVSAMKSLRRLAAFRPKALDRVMSHPGLSHGISDETVPIVATLDGVSKTNPGLIDVLLDPSRVLRERRNVLLPLSGNIILDIIRTAPGAPRSMDLLEHSVRGAEEYMGVPLPTRYVSLLFADAVSGSYAGTNFGTHIAVLPKFDVDDDSHEARFAGSSIAHEVAHYYWSGNSDWVDEGAADLMASIIEGARTGRQITVTNPPCAYADNIVELESLQISEEGPEFDCNYSLGERLFVDLNFTLGDERFREGFRVLYLASAVEGDVDDVRGTSVGVANVREAFGSEDDAHNAVIARWYEGTEPYDLSRLDHRPVNPSLGRINGRIVEAYITKTAGGTAASEFSAQDITDWVYLTLKYSYSVSGGNHEVPLEIVEYYEDGFEFGRGQRTLTAETRYIGGTLWTSVGQSPSRAWAPGRYVVNVYAGKQKVAEVEYKVTP